MRRTRLSPRSQATTRSLWCKEQGSCQRERCAGAGAAFDAPGSGAFYKAGFPVAIRWGAVLMASNFPRRAMCRVCCSVLTGAERCAIVIG